jgi:hypothetical protein
MKLILPVILIAPVLLAQPGAQSKQAPPKPFQAQSSSTISYIVKGDEKIVETHNVTYDVTGEQVPGRPAGERLVLRKTTQEKQVLGDEGEEATTTLEAWPFGADLKLKPLYALTLTGTGAEKVSDALWVVSRGTEEVDWWSVYKLGTAQHLFDTYVPLLKFSISLDFQTMRYVGLEVPPDDTADKRLKEAHVVAVLSYASEDKVIREALLTCDDPKQAGLLRSFADSMREISLVEGPRQSRTAPGAKAVEPSRKIRIISSQQYPSPPSPVEVLIPIVGDDLDLAHAQLPPKIHIAAWRR